jgi:hypothetical protein
MPRYRSQLLVSRITGQMVPSTDGRSLGCFMGSRWEAATMRRKSKRARSKRAKTKLGLPDLEQAKSAVLDSFVEGQPRFRAIPGDKIIDRATITALRFRRSQTDAGLLSPELAAGIRRVKGARKLRMRLGNWLTVEGSPSTLATSQHPYAKRQKRSSYLGCAAGMRFASRRTDRFDV